MQIFLAIVAKTDRKRANLLQTINIAVSEIGFGGRLARIRFTAVLDMLASQVRACCNLLGRRKNPAFGAPGSPLLPSASESWPVLLRIALGPYWTTPATTNNR